MAEPEKPEADKSPEEPATETISPPTSKASRIRLIIAIGLAVVVLAGGGVALAIVASRPNPADIALQQEKAAARQVVEKFAVLLEKGRNEGSFSLSQADVQAVICAEEQQALDQEWRDREVKDLAKSYGPTPSSHLSITVKDIRIEGTKGRATLVGGTDNVRADQDYALVKEETGWKVCGVTFRPKPSTTLPQPTDFPTEPSTTVPSTSETPAQ
ncbi:hypothetical protein LWC34_11275 [Kibdelosporangium philippinense]|uniref:DUF4878 domain-containing protein n=1 Tax=Kibdelosporangium philippinense TaxID=211113 RepID=A0ABS8Z6B6_9PSEU|nr:hypothetical protein [Kibdelosporangium philippinense]MCE7003405.1 hypothetical protein [Kibdelosporangium philippinense]